MARNEEKAQSMLYRFREAQAAELGLGTRADRRPRMASACKSLRECERWRGELLREISRKVSKIQDAGLTDYEVRDLNDEINKLMREKRHWENQIVALGGANYRRNVAMVDDDGREVPGTKGYKYFGRAKDLPGVKELFMSKKKEEDEENQTLAHYKKFIGQGPAYFGDVDEVDGSLLESEREAEEADWEEAHLRIRGALGLPIDEDPPKMPLWNVARHTPAHTTGPDQPSAKRKAPDDDSDSPDTVAVDADDPKRAKTGKTDDAAPASNDTVSPGDAARAAAAFIPFLTSDDLLPPKLPSRDEMEAALLGLRKQALMSEYFGGGGEAAEV
ncbi:Isy1-domain-containing protein [Gautieria morchelliformis]|nr:Isy1-domain-containing protein [Gautieria morchelliformis]